jgi:hypothetical protein
MHRTYVCGQFVLPINFALLLRLCYRFADPPQPRRVTLSGDCSGFVDVLLGEAFGHSALLNDGGCVFVEELQRPQAIVENDGEEEERSQRGGAEESGLDRHR